MSYLTFSSTMQFSNKLNSLSLECFGRRWKSYWCCFSKVRSIQKQERNIHSEAKFSIYSFFLISFHLSFIFCKFDFAETFNILEARFRIKRIFLYHIFHIYIPSMLIVLLSWSTFWIPPSAVPARVTLVVTNFLTSMLVFSSAGKSIPEISYHTALEVFVLFNSVLIFMAMLEYLVVLSKPNFLSKVSAGYLR